jgi:hypothetical protein
VDPGGCVVNAVSLSLRRTSGVIRINAIKIWRNKKHEVSLSSLVHGVRYLVG